MKVSQEKAIEQSLKRGQLIHYKQWMDFGFKGYQKYLLSFQEKYPKNKTVKELLKEQVLMIIL